MVDSVSRASAFPSVASNLIDGLLAKFANGGGQGTGLLGQLGNRSPVSELQQLQDLAKAGATLTPVEQGTLDRLAAHEFLHAAKPTTTPSTVAATGEKKAETKGPVTIDDLKLSGATEQDKADLKVALEYLQATDAKGKPTSPTAVKLLEGIRDKGTTINFIHDGNDAFFDATNTIDWDPRSGLAIVDNKGNATGGTQSAALGLIHEADHAVNGLKKVKADTTPYENNEEKRVITGSEKRIAKDFGEPTRTNHFGTAVTLGSSTEFVAVPKK
jgi:hypothetical protein